MSTTTGTPTPKPTPAGPVGLSRTYPRWASLAVLCAGTLMTVLDGTIVTVALPAIQRNLGFSGPGPAWVVNAYLIPFGGLLLLAGGGLGCHASGTMSAHRVRPSRYAFVDADLLARLTAWPGLDGSEPVPG